MKEKKIFVLDTNVILHDHTCINQFEEHDVYIPIVVLEELDEFKKGNETINYSAREFIRSLDAIQDEELFTNGYKIGTGQGKIKIVLESSRAKEIIDNFPDDSKDNRILNTAIKISKQFRARQVVLVTKDGNLRMKARSLGLKAEDYTTDHVRDETLNYSGYTLIENVSDEIINYIYNNKKVDVDHLRINFDFLFPQKPTTNQYFILRKDSKSVIAMLTPENCLEQIQKERAYGIVPKNVEQIFALHAMMNPNISLVTVSGRAGSGKTLIALASALEQRKNFRQIFLARPIIALSNRDIGYLPGDINDKLDPYMQPLYDNLDFIKSQYAEGDQNGSRITTMLKEEKLKIAPLAYIRGRSLHNIYFIVDECFPYEQKVIIENNHVRKLGSLWNAYQKGEELPKVLSYNENENIFEYKNIKKVFYNGDKQFVKVNFNGRSVTCTESHKFKTENGWTSASSLNIGDFVYVYTDDKKIKSKTLLPLNDDQKQIVLGSYLGDGNVSKISLNTYRLRIVHGMEQEEYCKWKASMFNIPEIETVKGSFNPDKSLIRFQTRSLALKYDFLSKKTDCSSEIINDLDERGLAIWFMDDGTKYSTNNGGKIFSCSFNEETQKKLSEKLNDGFGIDCYPKQRFYKKRNKCFWEIVISKKGMQALSEKICRYVHPQLSYKLIPEYQNLNDYSWDHSTYSYRFIVFTGLETTNRFEGAYDIEVEHNHNYVIHNGERTKDCVRGGIVVHNCQNLSPHEVKTIITRAGEGTKIIFTGDTDQIDHPYLDKRSNGLSYLIERFQGQDVYAHIHLEKGERSKLADLAGELL